MENINIDLKSEQQNTLNTPRYKYSFAAKFFFFSMDLVAGKKDDLSKAKLLETLACIPYRAWEIRHYFKLTRNFANPKKTEKNNNIIDWSREAQDNEFMHLLVIHEKMKEDKINDKWYLNSFITFFIVVSYIFIAKTLAFFSQKRAFLFNAEFEDHAEFVYANLVKGNPQWEDEKVNNELVKKYADVDTWADVFRRIGLDERDHKNNSFYYCEKPEFIHKYENMPEIRG